MPTNFHGVSGDGFGTGKNAQFHLEIGSFFLRNRMKPRVLKRRGPGGFGNGTINRTHRQDIAHTSAQLALAMKGAKNATRFGEMRRGRLE